MNSLFQKTSSHWVKYSEYECREKDGVLYAMPTPKAKPVIIDPLEDADAMVLDALNGLAYDDDRQVVKMGIIKVYGANPGLMVQVDEYKV